MAATTTLNLEASRWIQVEDGMVKYDWLFELSNRRCWLLVDMFLLRPV